MKKLLTATLLIAMVYYGSIITKNVKNPYVAAASLIIGSVAIIFGVIFCNNPKKKIA